MKTSSQFKTALQDDVSEQIAIDALRTKSRKARKHLREKRRHAANEVNRLNNVVDRAAFKATRDGFTKKNKLPHHFAELITEAKRFIYNQKEHIDNKGVVHTISSRGHRKLFEVLTVLITSCDFVSGQVGVPKALYMDTTSHDAFMLQHAKRYGYAISSSTWYRYIQILKNLKVFRGEAIRIFNEKEKTVRSYASYKWLSTAFLTKIGVFKDHIRASVLLAYQKAIAKGLNFVWKVKNEPRGSRNLDLFTPPVNLKPN